MSDAPSDVESLRREVARLQVLVDSGERRLRAKAAVSRVLVEETSIPQAMPKVLAALGTTLQARLAALWVPSGSTLEVRNLWTAAHHEAAVWEQLCRRHRFAPGVGLPGRVWREKRPVWLQEIAQGEDDNLVRGEGLRRLRVVSGLAFPITSRTEVFGIVELFSESDVPPDDGTMEALRTVGAHIGQFFQQVRAQDELRRQMQQQQHLARASHVFSSSLDADQVLGELAKLAVPWLGDWSVVHSVEGDDVRLAASHASDPTIADRVQAFVHGYAPSLAHSSGVRLALENGKTQFIDRFTDEHVQRLGRDLQQRELMKALAINSYVVVPLFTRENAVAALTVVRSGASRPLTAEDIALVEELAGRAGMALSNARMYAETRAVAKELEAERETLSRLNDVARTIAGQLDPEALADLVTEATRQLTGAQYGAYFQPNDSGKGYMILATSGMSRDALASFVPSFEATATRVEDVAKDPRYARPGGVRTVGDSHLPVRSFMTIPVVARNGVAMGGMWFGHDAPGAFNEKTQLLAVALAAHAAVAMDNAQLYGDAQRLISELEKTNAELDQFAYVASHDLRAPLRGITNLALWIEEDLGTGASPKILEQLKLLKGRAARMDKLMNALLELARVGRARQRAERVDVTELLHETVDLLHPPATARVLFVGAMPTMVAERVALQQVFLNLLSNALQHAGREDVLVRVSAIEREHEVEFAVSDNGIGIAPEHHERVWQLFQTLNPRDVFETTGIGLTIVRKQVEAHGGRAWIDPDVREGATARFTWSKRTR